MNHKDAKLLIVIFLLFVGCAGRGNVRVQMLKDPPCAAVSGIAWAGPEAPKDRERLSNWCVSVGPPLVQHRTSQPRSGLIVVTWNKHESYGDLKRLLSSLDKRSEVVALLQEVSRVSENVPSTLKAPKWIGHNKSDDVSTIAKEFDMSLVYLPSMKNGSATHEDRGCAILSTLPVTDIVGIELPWVKQRRVAVMATIGGRIRVVSVHLDTPPRRRQQAAALADFLPRDLPVIIGGDFNAWWGRHDQAVREIDRVVPRIRNCGGATFHVAFFPLRLDHLFTTLPQNMRTSCFVPRDDFGSDHYPIVLFLNHKGTKPY